MQREKNQKMNIERMLWNELFLLCKYFHSLVCGSRRAGATVQCGKVTTQMHTKKKENIEPTYASRTIRLHNAFALVLLRTRFAKLFAKIVIRNRRIGTHSNACVNFTIRDHPLAPVVPGGLGFYPFHLVRFHLHHLLGIFLEGVLTRLHFLLLRFVITFPAFFFVCVCGLILIFLSFSPKPGKIFTVCTDPERADMVPPLGQDLCASCGKLFRFHCTVIGYGTHTHMQQASRPLYLIRKMVRWKFIYHSHPS